MKSLFLKTAFFLLLIGVLSADGQSCGSWVERHPSAAPPARHGHAMAYDSLHKQILMFGGCCNYLDTWTWDGTSWTQNFPSSQPSSSCELAMVYDEAHSRVVLFGGGVCGTGDPSETWLWDGVNWSLASPATSPPGRELHALAYDSKRGQVVLFGGVVGGSLSNDTWVWEGNTWTQKFPAHSPPPSASFAMSGDPMHGDVVLFRSDTWLWDGTDWTQASPGTQPPSTPSAAMVYDASRGRIVYFNERCEAWLWDGSNWAEDCSSTSPVPAERYYFAAAYDAARSQAVMFGGRRRSDGVILGDTWEFSYMIEPVIVSQPTNQFAAPGTNVVFRVSAVGTPPLSYQWRFNGVSIAGATNSAITVTNVGWSDSGAYDVVVANGYGSKVSAGATLTVLSAPAEVTPPTTPPTYDNLPAKEQGKDSLVVVTHGWQPKCPISPETCLVPCGPPDVGWVDAMVTRIAANIPGNWTVFPLYWTNEPSEPSAWTHSPNDAADNGLIIGAKFGKALATQNWNRIHLIAHSAGSGLIQYAAKWIKTNSPTTIVHTTFLDPYLDTSACDPARNLTHNFLGISSDWSDNYISSIIGGSLDHAYNVCVTSIDPYLCKAPPCCELGLGAQIVSTGEEHQWAHLFYSLTITSSDPLYEGHGFPFSQEGGNWTVSTNTYRLGNNPHVLGCDKAVTQNQYPTAPKTPVTLSAVASAWSSSGTVQLYDSGAGLTSGSPVWLALGITVTNTINFLTFDTQFSSPPDAQGLLSVTWDTNRIALIDETAVLGGLQSYTAALPGTFTVSDHVLGFRLDPYTNIASSLMVTNVSFGYVGLTNPLTLSINPPTNQSVSLSLTAPTGYTYLIKASTNLGDWADLGVVFNTNGTVTFPDFDATNFTKRFYRAVAP